MSSSVLVGEIVGAFGVLGWVKVRSYTDPAVNILDYGPWDLNVGGLSRTVKLVEGRAQAGAVVARLEGVGDRDQALALKGSQIMVDRDRFPKPPAGSYYWADLLGLEVVNTQGVLLGSVTGLLETGANDVLEVRGDRDRLIPFVLDRYIQDVDLDQKRILVDWDPEF